MPARCASLLDMTAGRLLLLTGLCAIAPLSAPAQNAPPRAPKFCAGCNYAGAKLAGADLTNAKYIAANFARADLSGVSFRNARFVAANFENADLRNAAFDGAQCTACNFLGAKLDGATFTGAQMMAANFKDFAASVSDEQLRQLLAGCFSCNFSGSRLAGRDLTGIPLLSVDFSGADLQGTRFDGSVLCWNAVNGTKRQPTCDKMAGAQTSAASFSGVLLCDDPMDRSTCVPVDAAMLRANSGSPLSGAALP
jgi:uncharacterized protein YjbI with pentapeptide repeats